jgi:hypothetical protein
MNRHDGSDLWLEIVQQDDQHGDEEGRVISQAGW